MGYEAITLAVTTLIFALIIMWSSSLNMVNKKDIKGFLPFFLMSIVLIIYAGFILSEFFFNWAWFLLESLILLNLIGIFMIIRGENGSK
jgi:hypothetical protein